MPEFEIHWVFTAWLEHEQCWKIIRLIRCRIQEIAHCQAEVPLVDVPPRSIKIVVSQHFPGQPEADRLAAAVRGQIMAMDLGFPLSGISYYLVGLPKPKNKSEIHLA